MGKFCPVSRGADFRIVFKRTPDAAADAPGRVNLIGEHTDYNEGFVLPTAIPQRARVEIARRDDDRVRVASANVESAAVAEYRLGAERRCGRWIDYVQGCTREIVRAGHRIGGFDALVTSRVPLGAGVSSSAALEVSVLRALRTVFALQVDDVALAMTGHRAENDFVGARVGVMDQMAASLCDTGAALLLDTRSLAWERIALPDCAELVVIDSGVAHSHAGGAYNTRRDECESAARLLGVAALRDVGEERLSDVARLPQPLGRRARHVVTENARVLATVEALRAGDAERAGRLFYISHESLRDDYEVSVPEIDLLVEIARTDADVYGARITGGGFGGSVVMLVRRPRAAAAAERIARAYTAATTRKPVVLVPDREQRNAT
jgi:galactokinase